jgi:hypothetical protein
MDNAEGGFQDSNRITLTRAVTDLDAPHRFIMNVVYELPFGRGRRFGNGAPQWSDTLFGGWMMDGIINYQSGTAFGVSANNVCRCFNQAAYANSNGFSGKLEGRAEDRLNRWFDTSAFSRPDQFTIGNMGPRSADLRNDQIAKAAERPRPPRRFGAASGTLLPARRKVALRDQSNHRGQSPCRPGYLCLHRIALYGERVIRPGWV